MNKRYAPILLLAFAATVSATTSHDDPMNEKLIAVEHDWAAANYQTSAAGKEAAFEALVERAHALSQSYPNRAEPKVWEAISRAGLAGAMGGISALFHAMPEMKKGRDLLLEAEKIDPTVLHGSVYTTLGSFYYKVPGGLIGFGDKQKALAYLDKAIAIAPYDMDANYFMGDYWMEQGDFRQARQYLEKVLAAPDVADRPVYSKGRKAEARVELARIAKPSH